MIFPRRCAGCGQPGEVFCSDCQWRLERFENGLCQHCGYPIANPGVFCTSCSQLLGKPLIASYARYQQPLQRALVTLKYRPDRMLARRMAGWLAELYQATGWQASLILPVPLGPDRLRQRGFNQAGLLADELAAILSIDCRHDILERNRETRSQVGLDNSERRENVAGAFIADWALVSSHNILLVDDLVTTGSTLRACSHALKPAPNVFGLTVARA